MFKIAGGLSKDGTFQCLQLGYASSADRNRAAAMLRKNRMNTTVMSYLDAAGPAIHLIKQTGHTPLDEFAYDPATGLISWAWSPC